MNSSSSFMSKGNGHNDQPGAALMIYDLERTA